MDKLPQPLKKSIIDDLPQDVRNHITRLRKLAELWVKASEKVSPDVRLGKVSRIDDELKVPVVVTLNRNGHHAKSYPIDEFSINGDNLLGDSIVYTDDRGEYSFLYEVDVETTHVEVNLGLKNQGEDIKQFQKILDIPLVKEKIINGLQVTVPGLSNGKLEKLSAEGCFTVNVTTLCDNVPMSGVFSLESLQVFHATSLDHKQSFYRRLNPSIQTNDQGTLSLQIFPLADEQEFIFKIAGEIFKVVYKKPKANKLVLRIPGLNEKNIVKGKTAPFGFIVNLKTFLGEVKSAGTVYMVSEDMFRYRVGIEGTSNAMNEFALETQGHEILILDTFKDWQFITFYVDGDEPQTIQFRKEM